VALIRDLVLQLAVWLAAGAATTVPTDSLAQAAPDPEYQLKAVFLFNFAQFVEWPTSAFPNSQTPLVIGILGDDPFGPYLDETVRGETVNDRPLVVRRYRSVEEITTCHILFISRREEGRVKGILDSLRGRSVLTVSDADRFASRGGMIRFVTDHHRIRFRINLEAAKSASLTLSSKLLRPAQIVPAGQD
jgi:uncharacterized protein DUF4154